MDKIVRKSFPDKIDRDTICEIRGRRDDNFYSARTDRNIGWITPEEQELIRDSKIGIAGCGGMGGGLAEIFVRLGVGKLNIADTEVFDISNINRQFAASISTQSKSKVQETGKKLFSISDDFQLTIFPRGITEDNADEFVRDCSAICDEVEFWAIGSRILLHQAARKAGVSVFNGNSVGFGARLFLFSPEGVTIEDVLGLDLKEAMRIEKSIVTESADPGDIALVMNKIIKGLVPEEPEYGLAGDYSDLFFVKNRLKKEGKASVISTTPPLAAGLLTAQVLLYLLSDGLWMNRDKVKRVPEMPGYLYLDCAKMEARIVKGKWW